MRKRQVKKLVKKLKPLVEKRIKELSDSVFDDMVKGPIVPFDEGLTFLVTDPAPEWTTKTPEELMADIHEFIDEIQKPRPQEITHEPRVTLDKDRRCMTIEPAFTGRIIGDITDDKN